MRLPSLRAWPPPLAAGEDTYQEFIAGTIPVKRVVTDSNEVLVIVEHEWGILRAFDEYLDAIRQREGPPEVVDYSVTWTGMTGGETRPTVIRLELRIDGLRARPRLLFHDVAMTPLWMLTQHAMLGLCVDRQWPQSASRRSRTCGFSARPRPGRPSPGPHPGRGAAPTAACAATVAARAAAREEAGARTQAPASANHRQPN